MYKPHKSRKGKLVDAGLENAKSVATIVAALADGGIPCGPLKAAAATAKEAIGYIQKIRTNQRDSAELARQTYDYIITIYRAVGDVGESQVSEKLIEDLEEVERVLRDVRDGARELHAKNVLKALASRESTVEKIKGFKDNLAQSLEQFKVSSLIELRANQAAQQQDISAITVGVQNIQLRLDESTALAENTSIMITSSLPPDPTNNLLGRETLISEGITALTAPQHTHLAILGHGGIGKTSVVLAIIHSPAIKNMFGKSRYFVPCDSILNTASLISALLKTLKGDAAASAGDPLYKLQACLSGLESSVLILDNFETTWTAKEEQDLTQVLLRLAGCPKLHLIVTMRGISAPARRLIKWTVVKPDLLSLEQATELFLKINPDTPISKYEYLHKLLIELDGLPLAVILLAELGEIYTCQELLQLWKKKKTAVLTTSPSSQHRLSSLDVSLSLSLESSLIVDTPGAYELLYVLSHLPDGVKGGIAQLEDMQLGFHDLDMALSSLLAAALVTKDTLGILQVLSPIRHYILSKPVESPQLLELYCYYIKLMETHSSFQPGDAEFLTAIKHLSSEVGNIVGLTVLGLQCKTPPSGLTDAAFMFTHFQSWCCPSTEIIELLVANGGDHPHVAQYLQCMGNIQVMQGQYSQAISVLVNAQGKFEGLGDLLRATQCLRNLGDIQIMQCNYPEAIIMLEDAQGRFEALSDLRGAAQCLQSLGDIQRMQCNYPEAISMVEDAQGRFEALSDLRGAAQCLQILGDIQRMQYNYPEAIIMLEDAQSNFEALGDVLAAVQCLKSLGDIQRMQWNHPEAIIMLEDAQSGFEALGGILGAARCLKSLGDIQSMQCNYPEAIIMLEDAQSRFVALGDILGAAHCLKSLGNIQSVQCNYPEAISMLEDAQGRFEALGYLLGAAQCLRSLGDIQRMQGNYPQAIQLLEHAQSHFQKMGSMYDCAWSTWFLAIAHWDSNLHEQALAEMKFAQTFFLELGFQAASVHNCETMITQWHETMASWQPTNPPSSPVHPQLTEDTLHQDLEESSDDDDMSYMTAQGDSSDDEERSTARDW